MAKGKWFGKDKGDDKADDAETPSNTTSGGEETTQAEGPAKAESHEGTAVYPPSPSDQAGEKTDNVAPAKKLPPDVPASEKGKAREKLPSVGQAIAAQESRVAELEAREKELEDYIRSKGLEVPGAESSGVKGAEEGGKKFRVTMGSHAAEVTAKDEGAAKAEFLRRQGIHTPGSPVEAEELDASGNSGEGEKD